MTKNPFDFSDLSDLPEDLAAKLHTDTDENARAYADVVVKGAEAGLEELSINQIMAAALRMGMEVPTQQTVRGYLNKAAQLGLISKPGRLTYGPPTGAAEAPKPKPKPKAKAAEVEANDAVVTQEVEAPPPAAEDDDPLASLGL